ncbi:hypothetical protein CDO81_00080 [Roseateles puraquae]|uniref:Uncharacterized protein n=1 Tax=Roseateles puraquae TaxID=431059 RepID=A0A254NJB6_9BURK|nr:hypothetical protein CDO81_00080 [Roseateles puraquae]
MSTHDTANPEDVAVTAVRAMDPMFGVANVVAVAQEAVVHAAAATRLLAPISPLQTTRISPDGRMAIAAVSNSLLVRLPSVRTSFHAEPPSRTVRQVENGVAAAAMTAIGFAILEDEL